MHNDPASYSKLLDKDFSSSDTASLSDESSFRHERYPSSLLSNRTKKLLTALLATIVLVYIVVSLALITTIYRHGEYHLRTPDPPYSPASGAIRYMTVKSADGYDDVLQGPPSEAHDEAWYKLVNSTLSRASYEEMQLGHEDPENSVAVADGKGGYMISLGVYHELHCLRRLKLYLYKEHYYPKLAHGSEEDTYELNHLSHCLEAIRLSLMCAGNTAMYSFQWPDSNEKVRKPKTKTNSERTCVDWSLIEEWAQGRSISLNPELERPDVEDVEVDHASMHHGMGNQ